MKDWLNQVVQICVSQMPFEKQKKLIQEKQEQFEQFDKDTQATVHELFRNVFEAKDSVYILSVFWTCVADATWTDDLIQCVLKEKNYTYAESIMIEFQLKYFQIGNYTQRKAIRKRSIEKLRQIGIGAGEYIPVENRNSKRVVIITEQLLNIRHSPTLVVYNCIHYLQQLGYEVMVFACPSDAYLPDGIWYRYQCATALEELHGRTVEDAFKGEKVYFYQINLCGKDCIARYREMYDCIREWNPLFVYEIGLLNAIGDIFSEMTTVVSEMLSIKDCSMSNAQIIIRMEENEPKIEKEIADNMESNQTQLWIKEDMPVFIDRLESEIEISRKQMHLPEDKFLVAVVGNRLDLECEEEFVELLKKLLHKNPRMAVVVIGETKTLSTYFSEEESIYFIGYQHYLQDVYDSLDLYVNPKREGGGYSSQMALQAGLPVVTLPEGDVAYMAGEDFIVADYEEMYARIEKHIDNELFHKEQCERALQRGLENSKDTHYMERKIGAIKEIIRLQERGEDCAQYTMSKC